MQPDNNNTQRPASFDAAVIQWLPFLRKIAARYVPQEQDREDIVQDTVESALARWTSYVPESGKIAGWLAWRMRGVISTRRRKREITAEELANDAAAVQPNQEVIADASKVVSAIGNSRAEVVLLRNVMGDKQVEIAREQGVSKERIRQLCEDGRRRVMDRLTKRVAA